MKRASTLAVWLIMPLKTTVWLIHNEAILRLPVCCFLFCRYFDEEGHGVVALLIFTSANCAFFSIVTCYCHLLFSLAISISSLHLLLIIVVSQQLAGLVTISVSPKEILLIS